MYPVCFSFGDLDIGYRFRPQELDISMGVLLLQQGRTSFLELMFQVSIGAM